MATVTHRAPITESITVEERIARAKAMDGSIVVGLGPSGCGKTDTVERVSLISAILADVDWYCYDSNGDVRVHMNGIITYHQQQYRAARDAATASRHLHKLLKLRQFVDRGFYSGPAKLPGLMRKMKQLVAEGQQQAKEGRNKVVKAILFIDEAGAVRDEDDTFWPTMRQARNAGVTIYTTGHRLKDWHPSARANIRACMLWKPKSEKYHDINGMRIPREVCAESKGDVVHYFIGDDPTPRLWNRKLYPESYPVELVVPAQPTVARIAGI